MASNAALGGVICALVTAFADGKPDLDNLQQHIEQLKAEGLDGLLLMGTTGEGTSMGLHERERLIEAALEVADDLMILAGTGYPSLPDTIMATKRAFEYGADGVVVLPPYYYKNVSAEGLFEYYRRVFDEAVPDDGFLMLYHIPQVSQVPIPFELIERLMEYAGERMAAIKDSSGDKAHALALCEKFPDLRVFVGHDKLLADGLGFGAAGCITAAANVLSPLAVSVYAAHQNGEDTGALQADLTQARAVLDRYPPAPASLKYLLSRRYGSVGWELRPPLMPLAEEAGQALIGELKALDLPPSMAWLQGL